MKSLLLFLGLICVLEAAAVRNETAPAGDCRRWRNPLFNFASPDPWFIYHDGHYYYCRSVGGIEIRKSASMVHWDHAETKVVWRPPANKAWSKEVWAPELHFINNRWYVYFAADNGENKNHRMYVLESESDNALGGYRFVGKLAPPQDSWAIDGTVLKFQNRLFFVWSGWEHPNDGFPQNLYISEMDGPKRIKSNRVLIAGPQFSWEKQAAALLEGPEALYGPNGKTFITYSASGSWTRHYAVGVLELTGNNPLNPGHWRHHSAPFLKESNRNHVYGTGHASFVKSKDGKENYIIYHAMSKADGGWGDRTARAQKFHFDGNGMPVFGEAVSTNQEFAAPSGC